MIGRATNLSWQGLCLQAAGALACLGASFSLAMLQRLLGNYYWPGNDAPIGFAVFLTLGVLLGMALPELWPETQQLFKMSIARLSISKKLDQTGVAQTAVGLAIAMLLLSVLWACLVSQTLADLSLAWSRRFLLTGETWRLIAFVLPALAAWPAGIALGLLIQLMYSVFVNLHCPRVIDSSQDKLQRVLSSAVGWITAGIALGWTLAQIADDRYPADWPVMVLIGVILLLASLFMAVAIKAAPIRPERESTATTIQPLPEIATRPSRSAKLATMTLGWLAVWGTVHWHGWLMGRPVNSITGTSPLPAGLVIFLVPIAIISGLRLTRRYISSRPPAFLTGVDRQGLALAALGLTNLLLLAATAWAFAARQTGPSVWMLSAISVVALLTISSGILDMSISALAIGRPSRFELWRVLGSQLTLGVLAGLLSLLLDSSPAGNTVALTLITVISTAVATITVIYDEPHLLSERLRLRPSTVLHLGGLVFLYAILGAVILVASQKKITLRTEAFDEALQANTEFGDELTKMITAIVASNPRNSGPSSSQGSMLLVGLPYRTSVQLAEQRQTACRQVTIESVSSAGLLKLREHYAPFDTVIIFVPETADETYRKAIARLLPRACQLTGNPEGLWLITDGSGRGTNEPDFLSKNVMANHQVTLNGTRAWSVFAAADAARRLAQTLRAENHPDFAVSPNE
jgi:hypothetical protein